MAEETTAAKQADSATAPKEEGGKPPANENKDGKADSSTEQPWHKDPRFKDFMQGAKTFEKLQKIMKDNGLDDPDDLAELVTSGKVIKGKINDPSIIDELLEKAGKHDAWVAHWAKEKREQADPETRAQMAEQELAKDRAARAREKAAKEQTDATKKALASYEKEVQGLIAEATYPKDQQPFVQMFFGVGNPSNDVDITDKKAIKKLYADQTKTIDAFKQSVIAEYLESKKGIVKTGQGAESVGGEKPPRMNLKLARAALLEGFGKLKSG